MKVVKLALALGAAGASIVAVPAGAVITTFATFSSKTPTANVVFANSGNGSNRTTDATFKSVVKTGANYVAGSPTVRFSFLQTPLAAFVDNVDAAFTLNASIAKGTPVTGNSTAGFTQKKLSGTFSFVSLSAITVTGPSFIPHTYAAGSNLLSGSFTPSTLSGSGSSGSVSDSNITAGVTITFSSDFLDFTQTVQRDIGFTITSIIPSLSAHVGVNKALSTFRGTMGGQFSSDPAPVINGLAVVPEPASWALMVAGFGLVGLSARRRSRVVAA